MRRILVVLAFAGLFVPGQTVAQVSPGDRLEHPDLEGFTQIEAKSTADFVGRAVLYEFFAFW